MRSFANGMLEAAFPNHRYYGWVVVFACFLCAALSAPGQSYALGLYFESFATDFGTDRMAVSSVYAWATVVAAALLPVIGRLADRWPAKVFMGAAIAGIGTALLGLAHADTLVGLALGLFFLRLLGQGAIGLGTITSVLRWFDQHRGRAVAIAALGYGFGEFTMPALITELQSRFGWRGSMLALGAAYFVCALLLSAVLRDAPMRMATAQPSARAPAPDISAHEAIRIPVFWALLGLVAISPMLLTGLLLHQIAIFRDASWDPARVASALQAYAVCNVVATYATGLLLERTPAKFGIPVMLMVLSGAVVVPLLGIEHAAASMAFGALLGAAAGSAAATNGVIWAEYFGVTSIGAIKGIVSAVRNGSTAAGAVGFAALAGPSGEYGLPLASALSIALLGAASALLLPRSNRTHVALDSPSRLERSEAAHRG